MRQVTIRIFIDTEASDEQLDALASYLTPDILGIGVDEYGNPINEKLLYVDWTSTRYARATSAPDSDTF